MLINKLLTSVAPPLGSTVCLVRAGMAACQCSTIGGGIVMAADVVAYECVPSSIWVSGKSIKSDRSKLSPVSLKNFIMFLKFIRFTKELEYEIQKFDNILYRVLVFRVKDFSDVCDSMFKFDNNYYKIRQVKQFLRLVLLIQAV